MNVDLTGIPYGSLGENLILFAATKELDPGAMVELVLWIFVFIATLIIGALVLKRLRTGARAGGDGTADDNPMERFDQLYRKKLITRDEYLMIRKNVRDHLVHEYQETGTLPLRDPRTGTKVRMSSPSQRGIMNDAQKANRLHDLLHGEDRRD